MMEEGTHGPFISRFPSSTFQVWDKKGKVRLAEERVILEKDRRVGQEGGSILFERRNSECTSKTSEYGVCVHSLHKLTLPEGLSADGKLVLVFCCHYQRHRLMHSYFT